MGGMRNPWIAVKRLSKVAEVGWDLSRLWRRFAKEYCEVLWAAKEYGGNACKLEPDLVEAWKGEMKDLLRGRAEDEGEDRVQKPAGRQSVGGLAKDVRRPREAHRSLGAPLGMSVEIPMSGVFPKAVDVAQAPAVEEAPALEWRSAFKNYSSVETDPEGAALELGRYLDKGFAKRMAKADRGGPAPGR